MTDIPDEDEDALRAALLSTILDGIARRGRPLSEMPEITGLPEILLAEIAAGRKGLTERTALWPLRSRAGKIEVVRSDGR